MMRTVLINLPSPKRLIRRFTCSYHASNFLFPPLELLSLAAIIKEWKRAPVRVIDAVAERCSLEAVIHRLRDFTPEIIVFMTGIESFASDLRQIETLHQAFPEAKIVLTGYLPTQFPAEVLRRLDYADHILLNEPELSFSELYDCLGERRSACRVAGTASREAGEIFVNPRRPRIRDLDRLPPPARELVDADKYHELLSPRPFTTVESSRGCPAGCTYCIRTFGLKVGFRSAGNLIEEIRRLVRDQGVRSVRFTDDNFCLDRRRVKEFCRLLDKENLSLQWSCLSRVDTVDEELLRHMKKAGCFRIYLGIETFSQRLLDSYEKNCDVNDVFRAVGEIQKAGIETVGFFMVGGLQTREELERDIRTAKKTGLDYVVVEKLTPYPGTPLFERMRGQIDFQLFPYLNRLKDPAEEERVYRWEKEFYRRFYLSPGFIGRMTRYALRYPRDLWVGLKDTLKYAGAPAAPGLERGDLI